jgi:hypothetical protein
MEESIFLRELRAAIDAIMELAEPGDVVVLIIDNTAAAEVLRSGYSTTSTGLRLVMALYDHMQAINVFLIVAGIAGVDNDADSPTRGEKGHPSWCGRRLEATWHTGQRALHGCERVRLNPAACGMSHRHDEAESTDACDPEDTDCDNLSHSVEQLMKHTAL